MNDVIVILMTLGFFAVCVGYVALCDRIIGHDPEPESVLDPDVTVGSGGSGGSGGPLEVTR